MNLGRNHEHCKLTAEAIERDYAHPNEQYSRDYTYKNVSNNEAVPEPPQNPSSDPTKAENEEEDGSAEYKKTNPSPKVVTPGKPE